MKTPILTLTPNPALDIIGVVDRIKVNEKTYVHNEKRSPGGNAINAARILHSLKVPVVATGFLGGSIGDEVRHLLDAEGLRHDFVQVSGSTRANVTVSTRLDHKQTRLSFEGPRINSSEVLLIRKRIKDYRTARMLIIGGSLPPQFRIQDLRSIIHTAQQCGIPLVVDCPGKIMKHLLSSEILLIKPNLDEFQTMTGSRVRSVGAVKRKAEPLLNKISYICISSVDGGALLMSRTGCYFGRAPAVRIRSTVGAGDSMVGMMSAQIFKGNSCAQDILKWGLAAAAATLSEPGVKLGHPSQISMLYKKTEVSSI